MSTISAEQEHVKKEMPDIKTLVGVVIDVLQRYMCPTLAVRVSAFLLFALRATAVYVTEMIGLCDRSARELRKQMRATTPDEMAEKVLSIKSGGGRPRKLLDYAEIFGDSAKPHDGKVSDETPHDGKISDETPDDGATPNNGEKPSDIKTPEGGKTPNNGEKPNDSKTPEDGATPNNGEKPNDSKTPEGGKTPNDGEKPNDGKTPNDGEKPNDSKTPEGGKTADNGKETDGNNIRKRVAEEIWEELTSGNFYSLQQVADMITEKMQPVAPGFEISLSTVWDFLRRNGYRKLKVGSLPKKADPEKQRAFYLSTILPILHRATYDSENVVALFADASHFVMGCGFLRKIWCPSRRYVKTLSGRQRYNVLGALKWGTKDVVTVTNDAYVNGITVCNLLYKVWELYRGKQIHLFLDNAAYQKSKMVQSLAESLGITLHYLPSYSPVLNFIERLWKFLKGILRTKAYDDFKDFKKIIDKILSKTGTTYKEALDSLIDAGVQILDNLEEVGDGSYQLVS